MEEKRLQLPHALTVNERNRLSLTGVSEVVSFDENAVVLHTSLGMLTVHGEHLQLRQLSPDGGQVAVDGNICALIYEDPRPTGSWLQRFFR